MASEILPPSDEVGGIVLYDRANVPSPVRLGIDFGFLVLGWTLRHYLLDAATKESGYETGAIWGTQGNGKSSRMLMMLFWVYSKLYDNVRVAWDIVLERIVFRPTDFITMLEELPDGITLAAIGWDDIGVHYPSTKFKTDIKTYEAIDSTWASIRTKVHVVLLTIPVIDRLAKNIKDNVTFEIFIGKNRLQLVNRWFRLPGFKENSNFFKAELKGERKTFNVKDVPLWVWRKYWARRIELTKEALANLKAVSKGDIKGMIPVLDAAEIAFTQDIKMAASTIQQNISRSVFRGEKVGTILLVDEDDFYRELVMKGGVDLREKEESEISEMEDTN